MRSKAFAKTFARRGWLPEGHPKHNLQARNFLNSLFSVSMFVKLKLLLKSLFGQVELAKESNPWS